MEVKSSSPTCIFFLTLSKELPDFFFQAANWFNSTGVTLIPVNLMELKEIKKGEQDVSVLVHTSCLDELIKFYKLRESYLDMAMNTKKFRIFQVTSFGRIPDLARAQRMGNYHFMALPALTREICHYTAKKVFKYQNNIEQWPGGRRSKLPFTSLN